jgi:uncharacterized protein (DUF488 family)
MEEGREILTIGHSTHPIESFLALVREHSIEAIADVRRRPASRRNPQFNSRALEVALVEAGTAYVPFGDELGGLRRPRSEGATSSLSGALAAYAQHMEGEDFQAGLGRLEELARDRRTAVMCAEADWRNCHRQLIADSLVERGWRVMHVGPDGGLAEHPQQVTLDV